MERLTKKNKCKLSHGEEIVICKHSENDCNDSCMKIIPCKWYTKAIEKLKFYEDLEERLNKIYGECDGLLESMIELLEEHSEVDIPDDTVKVLLLTNESVDFYKKCESLEKQGRLIKLPAKDGTTAHRECVHIKSTCYHENYKCSECPLTELFCDEFYKAIDRCYEEAYASGCLAGMDLAKTEAEAKLKEYKALEEQGRLLKLPCTIGDTVYLVDYRVVKARVYGIAEQSGADRFSFEVYTDVDLYEKIALEDYGDSWFTTKSEAEAKLKELRGGEDV